MKIYITYKRAATYLLVQLLLFTCNNFNSFADCVVREYSVSGTIDSRQDITPDISLDYFRWRDAAQSLDVTDSLGIRHPVQFSLARISESEWQVCLIAGRERVELCRSIANFFLEGDGRQAGTLRLPFEPDWTAEDDGNVYIFTLNNITAQPIYQSLNLTIHNETPARCAARGPMPDLEHEATGGVVNRYTEGVYNDNSD